MRTISLVDSYAAAERFKLPGIITGMIPYGCGHINDTFLVETQGENGRFRAILQAVNTLVFPNTQGLIENIDKVTSYLRRDEPDPRRVMVLIEEKDGSKWHRDAAGRCWRMYAFIENSLCLQQPRNEEDFFQCAVAFGDFQRRLSDFPVKELCETIKDFHNTPKRYDNLCKAVEKDAVCRKATVSAEIRFYQERASFYGLLLQKNREGRLPLRVTHNDTKCNNVMLDEKTGKALCVIDLDTVMPGFSVNDFGDAIRFGANTAAEDETDLSAVRLDIDLFRSYTAGYLQGCDGRLTKEEIMLLPEGAKMMTLECGMRFLTDYLEGDRYFKTAYAEHNLVRCRTQIKLVQEMEAHWDELKDMVASFL